MIHNRGDLVVLVYAANNCYTDLLLPDDPRVAKAGVTIDEARGTWTYSGLNESAHRVTQQHQIGEGFSRPHGWRWGVIGVYNKADLEHLRSMISDAKEALKEQGSVIDD